ncbi:flagellar hook-basal body complex protein FliE [bacterium]|nr:flagellar hook-basal body complex protein FliE [bacterium]
MSSQMSISAKAAEDLFARFNEIRRESSTPAASGAQGLEGSLGSLGSSDSSGSGAAGKLSFFEQLQARVAEVNEHAKTADKMATSVATGKSENLHEAMLAASTAELTFNLMVQVRNRALEAYQEVMRMPV